MHKFAIIAVTIGLVSGVGCGDDDESGGPAQGGSAAATSGQGRGAHRGGTTGSGGGASGGVSQAGGGAGPSPNGGAPTGGMPSEGGAGATSNGGTPSEGGAIGASSGGEGATGGDGGAEPTCDDWPPAPAPSGDCADTTVSGLTVTTNAELEALRGVSVIDGDLTIGESSPSSAGVTSVAALSCLTRVTGTVTFVNTALRDLRGMERLTEVDGWLSFDGNGALTSLSGLDGLTTVGGTLELGAVRFAGPSYWYSSPPVESLCPLRNLRSLGGLLAANLPLQNLSGLEHLTELGSLILFQTESLRSLRGLENLQRIYGEGSLRFRSGALQAGLILSSMPSIRNLEPLANLRELTTVLIDDNRRLTDIRAIAEARGVTRFEAHDNPSLEQCQVQEVAAEIDRDGQLEQYVAYNNAACMP